MKVHWQNRKFIIFFWPFIAFFFAVHCAFCPEYPNMWLREQQRKDREHDLTLLDDALKSGVVYGGLRKRYHRGQIYF